jgi:xanthine dehydrogenase small subunit
MTERKSLIFYINGERHEVPSNMAFTTLSDYLRYKVDATGTKVVCAEGDCGACTVLQASVLELKDNNKFDFKVVNSCILFLGLIDGKHIVTIEGVSKENQLHSIQKSFVEHHGAQCGFCTPGFICALAGLLENKSQPNEKQIKNGLTGNLCRCTGYQSIIDSTLKCKIDKTDSLSERYSNESIIHDLQNELKNEITDSNFASPLSLAKALALKNIDPTFKLISGASDLGVLTNKFRFTPHKLMSLQHIYELSQITIENKMFVIGANSTLHQVQKALAHDYPEFCDLINIFASPQIKNRGTLVGNLANASPIADTIPFLIAVNAELEIQSVGQIRKININDFYIGYKKLDLKENEIITRIFIPQKENDSVIKLFKVSKRKDLDISVITFAGKITKQDKKVKDIRLVYGGVGPIVLRMNEAENYLKGKDWSNSEIKKTLPYIQKNINPLSDVRGSDLYRRELAANLLTKFFIEVEGLT